MFTPVEVLPSVRRHSVFDGNTPDVLSGQPGLDLMCGWLSHLDFPNALGGG